MRLPIEDWVDVQGFKLDSKDLFEESITCYKASAYKAALLFSFLGFQQIIKERILNADKPDYYQEHSWETIKRELMKEEAWDIAVNEAIKKSDANKKVFNISEDIRQQAIYWRYRRNDCAHSKPNIINSSHVEAFWFFLISNLAKFVVDGGKDSLIQKIKLHFDSNFTRHDVDFMYLIEEIPNAIQDETIDEFVIILNKTFEENEFLYPAIAVRAMSFWNELINLQTLISKKVIEFIKMDEELEIAFLLEYPEKVSRFFYLDPPGIRNLWRVKLNKTYYSKFGIFTALLLNGLLESDKEEALDHYIRNNTNAIPTELQIPHLHQHGYFAFYRTLVFREVDPLINLFSWGNTAMQSLIGHIDIMGLDEEIVRSIEQTFSMHPYPFKLQEALFKYFNENVTQRDKYIEICGILGMDPTDNIIES